MAGDSTFRFRLPIPKHARIDGRNLDREAIFAWIWTHLEEFGLLGVHEGSILSEEAAEKGLETESWTVDAAEAPRSRDWVEAQQTADAELYFASEPGARHARDALAAAGLSPGEIVEQEAQDWDAEWKASFLNQGQGVPIPPFWRIVPPWLQPDAPALHHPGEIALKINPGAGFGTGTHETTQLCLRALGELYGRDGLRGARVLDFGSGSGILSIGAALLGGQVIGVEIDPLAVENARENAALNAVETSCLFGDSLADAPGPFRVVLANILRPVLLQFARELTPRVQAGGALILSGLIDRDVPEVIAKYEPLMGSAPKVAELGEWRSLVWSKSNR